MLPVSGLNKLYSQCSNQVKNKNKQIVQEVMFLSGVTNQPKNAQWDPKDIQRNTQNMKFRQKDIIIFY